MEKEKNKEKSEILKFLRISAFIAFDKIGANYALPANSIKICLGYFCMQNSYLR